MRKLKHQTIVIAWIPTEFEKRNPANFAILRPNGDSPSYGHRKRSKKKKKPNNDDEKDEHPNIPLVFPQK